MRLAALIAALILGCSGEPGPPTRPDSVTGRALGVRGAEIGWRDRSGGSAWHAIERRGPGEAAFSEVGLRPPGETVWEEWGLRPASGYEYRVRARSASADSPPSDPVGVETPSTVIPEPRVTVVDPSMVSPGATLFNVEDPHNVGTVAVLMAVDEEGVPIWQFEHEGQIMGETDVCPDGDILAQTGPRISRMNRKGDLVDYVDEAFIHHDVDDLPWGNLLALSVDKRVRKVEVPTDRYAREWVVEIDRETKLLLFILHLEFIVPLVDVCRACIADEALAGRDWLHANSVEYDLSDEAIYVSIRNLNRIYKISYPEGEVEWVMGDGGDFGAGLFHHQHSPVHLAPGRMLVFDNGLHSDPIAPDRSRVVEIEYDPDIPAARIAWVYDGPPTFYSESQGYAQRLSNGNTLVVDSTSARIVEVTPAGLTVWELYLPPPYYIYKAHRIENFL